MFNRVSPTPTPPRPGSPEPQRKGPQPLDPKALAVVAGGGTPKGGVGTNGWSWG